MILYDFCIEYDIPEEDFREPPLPNHDPAKQRCWSQLVSEMNEHLGLKCGLDGCLSAIIVSGEDGCIHTAACCKIESVSLNQCKDFICDALKSHWNIDFPKVTKVREISVKDFEDMVKNAVRRNYFRGPRFVLKEMTLNYFDSNRFRVKERCLNKELTYKSAVRETGRVMSDSSFYEELERVYASENVKKFYGHPVHYKLTVGTVAAAMDIVDILIPALKKNGRLLGNRIVHVYDIGQDCYDDENLEHLFAAARGNTVVIELAGLDEIYGNHESSYEHVIGYFRDMIMKFANDTLCIFIDNTEHPGFARNFISQIQTAVDIVEIREGCGNHEQAVKYFMKLAKQADFPVSEGDAEELLPQKDLYTVTEVYNAYQKWPGTRLRNKLYKSYQTVSFTNMPEAASSSDPYKELQEMVGLPEIKELVNRIIAMGKADRMRNEMGMDTCRASMHMIFTGNPGSAKTTVARLIAQILRQEGILNSGNFVECGRADLVGKYVGWTARLVRQKFREAAGGILFIDEAYSLVDDTNSFGDEAINAIVQEMENHREDVIVIFAGYPEKMSDFLDKNEGLQSRVAFYMDFPDYSPSELLEILHLMCRRKGCHMGWEADEKCMRVFEGAVHKKEIGNGRFVRNLLEQAMMKQSVRILRDSRKHQVSREEITELTAEDFEVALNYNRKVKQNPIGFSNRAIQNENIPNRLCSYKTIDIKKDESPGKEVI